MGLAAETDGADLSGRQIGDYRLLRRVGRGAMAEVYLAEQGSLRRQVAFKVLKGNLATDATYVKRFQVEAQAAAALVHANIVQIHEVGCVDGIHFIAQEYVSGTNLHERLMRLGPTDVRLAVAILRQAAAALQKAAEQGIVHRDIKPENILLAYGNEVKVADFGLARLLDDGGATQLTQAGFTLGTPLYMSPEQVEGKPLDTRSDIYSLGVTCYHMLAGQPPFRGDTALSVAVQHLNVAPPRLEQSRPDLPPALCRIVHKMLAKDRIDRYASPRHLLKDLKALAVGSLSDGDLDVDSGEATRCSADRLKSPANAHAAATEQLAAVMRGSALPRSTHAAWRWTALAAVFALLLGLALAWATRAKPLLTSLLIVNELRVEQEPLDA